MSKAYRDYPMIENAMHKAQDTSELLNELADELYDAKINDNTFELIAKARKILDELESMLRNPNIFKGYDD